MPLQKPLILLDKNKIKKSLNNKSIAIDIVEKIKSTNDYLKNHRDRKTTVCLAETQTQGRGRLGRAWHSPFGQNIYFSMQHTFEKDMSELSGLSLLVALAVTHAIESILPISNLKIKWPNDIVVGNKKIAGILIDVQAESNGFCHAIMGVGINVNMKMANRKQINQAWNSLQKITKKYIDRNPLCAALINSLVTYLKHFSNHGLSDFMDEWKNKDYLFQKSIQLQSGTHPFSGIASGINAQGHLLLALNPKTVRAFSSGDVSIV